MAKCDVCGKDVAETFVRASSMGPVSYAYCTECLTAGLEPYDGMVAYIAGAGHFPDDINAGYQAKVRNVLTGLGISEEKFIADVEEVLNTCG